MEMEIVNMLMEQGSIQVKYDGIYEIYPQKVMNTYVLNKALQELQQNGYQLTQIFNGWVRAMK
mgnify:CR=1 FL=1